MSQEKVNLNKERKINRKKEVHKRKINHIIEIICICAIAIALIGWIGFSVYKKHEADVAENPTVLTTDTSALNDYIYSLQQ